MMTEGEEYLWNLEFDSLRVRVRSALNHLNDLSRRNDVKGWLEDVCNTLDQLYEMTKGESK